ncbi:hypothetical protein ACTXT7_016688, partial [Hymenolepis weldensis]
MDINFQQSSSLNILNCVDRDHSDRIDGISQVAHAARSVPKWLELDVSLVSLSMSRRDGCYLFGQTRIYTAGPPANT